MIEGLRDCFREEFGEWLLNSNCPDVGPFKRDWWMESSRMRRQFDKIQSDSLKAILDILLIHPEADYFWYSYTGKLTYALPHHEVVASGSIRVDSDKIKILLRDIKINQILK